VFADVKAQFSTEEIAALTFQIVAINGLNRLTVGLRSPVGDYISPFRADAGAPPQARGTAGSSTRIGRSLEVGELG
jgi:hypothetical protein